VLVLCSLVNFIMFVGHLDDLFDEL